MVRLHLHHRTRFSVRYFAAGAARRSRFSGARVASTSGRVLTTPVIHCETRDATWNAPPVMGVPSGKLQQPESLELPGAPELGGTSELGGAMELGETPEPAGLDGFDSSPSTPLLMLGRGILHQLRVASPAGSTGHGGQGEQGPVDVERLPAPDDTIAPSDDPLSTATSRPRRATRRRRTRAVRLLRWRGLRCANFNRAC